MTNFYNMLRKKLYAAQPNEGHKLIKSLENDYDVCVITQNVDDLHERVGSKNVIHLHGELSKVCTSLNVYPAAGRVQYTKPGTPIYLIDPNEVMSGAFKNITHIKAGASEGMKKLIEVL